MVRIQQDKNGNDLLLLGKILQLCLSEKHGEKKNSLVNLTLTHVCFQARSRLNRSPPAAAKTKDRVFPALLVF